MMRDDEGHHSRKFRFYPFVLDLTTGELCRYQQRIRLQRQPLLILKALLANPGETVSREELRELIWPENVLVDYEHGLNRSMNKLRRALGDTVAKPRYIETLHGRGYRFIAPVQNTFIPGEARLAVLPVENFTGSRENDALADGIVEALIDELGRRLRTRLRVLSLLSVWRYRNKGVRVARVAAELGADYLVCGRLRQEEDGFRLRVELVDARDRTSRWAKSFTFDRDGLEWLDEICTQIAARTESTIGPSADPASDLVNA